jgi:hypothetical protein
MQDLSAGSLRGWLSHLDKAPASGPRRESPEGRTEVGILTESMTQLRDEIVSARHARMALRGDLVRQTNELRTRVSALCAGFARDRAGARRAWFGPALSERRAAEIQPRHRLAEAGRAKAQAEEQPPAAPKAEPHGHEPAPSVPAPVARTPVAPLPSAKTPPLKGSRRH